MMIDVKGNLLYFFRELSDMNKDGKLELEEFIVAMHLIDSVKSGMTIPDVLPNEIIPPQFKNAALAGADIPGGRTRSASQTSQTSEDLGKSIIIFYLKLNINSLVIQSIYYFFYNVANI